ncbi:MAG: acetolactate decarboxylase [Victivallaceae bacterium]|nr:acetolactate decarboxylase [Victivallaceae bacterium]
MIQKAFAGFFALTVCGTVFLAGCLAPRPADTISQVSTIDALLAGVYSGELSLGQLLEMGDTGIGTFDCLDGEMLVLDGRVYQVKADGRVYTPSGDMTTPFAAVIYFRPDNTLSSAEDLNFAALKSLLDKYAPAENLFYAFKIKGAFKSMKTRSVPRQKKPFPPLAEVVKTQPVFAMENIRGTIVGFRCPAYVKGINVGGYHLHFISSDRRRGGHILDFEMQKGAVIEIDRCNKFFMRLPESAAGFHKADLTKDRSRELHRVEQ